MAENPAELSEFFDTVLRIVNESEKNYGYSNGQFTEYIIERLQDSIASCHVILQILEEAGIAVLDDYVGDLKQLILSLEHCCKQWINYEAILESRCGRSDSAYRILTENRPQDPYMGRPRYIISKDQLVYLSSLDFNWTEIAAILGVSRMTLYRRRAEFSLLEDPNNQLSDEDLLSIMKEFRTEVPYVGTQMMCGLLRSRGIKVCREKVRQLLRIIDPLSATKKWPMLTQRRPYSVPGPNSLWHIDSHHKLIRWRIITHGGIDGYSRLIVYLDCNCNNTSATVYDLFLKGTHSYGLPSRVRSDQGTENVLVARHMIQVRGEGRGSMITGSSTHNQRIERLWRDMHRCCTILYYRLFHQLENYGILDPLNEYHMWALHYVYLPRISRSLKKFAESWNNHSIRTSNHHSPLQLFTSGLLLLQNSQLTAMDYFNNVDASYGIDNEEYFTVTDDEGVNVPRNTLKFSHHDLTILRTYVDPLSPCEDWGIELYQQTVQMISNFIPL